MTARCLPLLFVLMSGCGRRLPGPAECRAFALAAVGVEPGTPASALEGHQRLVVRAEELTRDCLTTPWDYPLLNCLQNGGNSRACMAGFERRRLGAANPPVLRVAPAYE